jgi:hypothetical protein
MRATRTDAARGIGAGIHPRPGSCFVSDFQNPRRARVLELETVARRRSPEIKM